MILISDNDLNSIYSPFLNRIDQAVANFAPRMQAVEVGRVISVAPGIARMAGLSDIGFEELVKFSNGEFGIALDLDLNDVGIVLLCDHTSLNVGDQVERMGRVIDVAVGSELLGRVVDPLGRPLDGAGPVRSGHRLPIERPSAGIMDRLPVTAPLQTGIKAIDAMVPIGRGQRELIIGDRKTGKTTIAIDAIINQRNKGVLCIYCAIGQRSAAVAKVIDTLRKSGAMPHCVVVVAEGNESAGLSYIAPYAATSMAEYFMQQGQDVLIVYDDLTQHARSYRELSLLLRRPPGREAFPGDIFFIHSRLLERSTHLNESLGGGSLTALPVVETEAQNISAYIPTNLISITDGQIYLSPALFELGILPAIDIGKSVSRVGGKAQKAAYRAVVSDLKLAFAQYEELESFARFGAHLDEASQKTIDYGRRIQSCLKQSDMDTVSFEEQILILIALTDRLFDPVPLEQMPAAQHALRNATSQIDPELRSRLNDQTKLEADDRAMLVNLAEQALTRFSS